jgi:hypothetical protein
MSKLGTHLQGRRAFKHHLSPFPWICWLVARVRRQKHSGKGNSTTALEALYSALSLLPVLYPYVCQLKPLSLFPSVILATPKLDNRYYCKH